jgi:hypothetical protein
LWPASCSSRLLFTSAVVHGYMPVYAVASTHGNSAHCVTVWCPHQLSTIIICTPCLCIAPVSLLLAALAPAAQQQHAEQQQQEQEQQPSISEWLPSSACMHEGRRSSANFSCYLLLCMLHGRHCCKCACADHAVCVHVHICDSRHQLYLHAALTTLTTTCLWCCCRLLWFWAAAVARRGQQWQPSCVWRAEWRRAVLSAWQFCFWRSAASWRWWE